ncbi:MAG: hypothetical protein Q8N23_12900 [Archangium sp.]|nr:hypothetical protein [Archangium sp.]MDP3153568.1 hypothetical protein [Archangium sp.]MDP3574509.1 hypothetical protein [Archangium sp.]
MLALSLLMLAATPAPLRVAVPNFNVINIQPEAAAFFMDRFANRLRSRGLAVTTATEIETVLGLERQKQLLGCAENSSSCQAEIAAALGADAIVRARVARFGQRFELTLTLIDPANAAVIGSISGSATDEGKVLDTLEAGADEFTAKLVAAKRGKAVAVAPVEDTPVVEKPVVEKPVEIEPARIAAAEVATPARPFDKRWLALIPVTLGALSVVAGGGYIASSITSRDQIAISPEPEAMANQARSARVLGILFLGVGAAGMTTAAVLFFTGKAPEAMPIVALTPAGGFVGVEGRLP